MKYNLGSLETAYQNYLAVIEDIPEDSTVAVMWRREVAHDKEDDARKKLAYGATHEEYRRAMEAAQSSSVSERYIRLLRRGFGQGVIDLFNKISISELSDEEEADQELQELADKYAAIPLEHQLGAKVVQNTYYYGGRMHPLVSNITES